jgi:hypothetical protein
MEKDIQIIYVLTNSSMPGLVKIGKTSRSDVESRMRELYSTGVPVPYECYYACQVENASKVEKSLHLAFGDLRVNPNREFFKLSPDKVHAILQHLQINEVTIEINNEIDDETDKTDRESATRLYKETRRPTLRFDVIGIPVGAILKFRDEEHEVKVVSDRKVEHNGEEMSLSMVTRRLLGKADDYPIQPSPYWSFNGKTLFDIYDEFYSLDD